MRKLIRNFPLIVLMLISISFADNKSIDYRKYADVKQWTGQINYSYQWSWNEQVGAGHRTGQCSERGTSRFHLDKIHITSTGVEWRGDGQTGGNFSLSDTFEAGKVKISGTRQGTSSEAQPNNWIEMDFDKKTLRAGAGGGKSVDADWSYTMTGPSVSRSWTEKAKWSTEAARVVENEPLQPPSPGSEVSGSTTITDVKKFDARAGIPLSQPGLMQPPNLTFHAQWDFTPVWDDIDLVIDIDDYDKWIPEATMKGILPGNYLTAHATLKTKDGQPLHFLANRIKFELKETSKEPGVCMNWPAKSDQKELPDLQFDPTKNKMMELVDPDFQIIQTPSGKYEKATATIGCYDWGAWSDLRVTAELPDGRIIVGHLKDHADQILVPIPKRADGSVIAEHWKELHPGSENRTDDTDDEHVPGNEHNGDGFSLYEEYRGFYVNGKHICLDCRKKDLFVLDKVKGETVRGFAMFQNATGIIPRYQLREEEMPADRAMDFNRSDRTPVAYQEKQHGVVIKMSDNPVASATINDSQSKGPTVPKHVIAITLTQKISPFQGLFIPIVRNGKTMMGDKSGATIAHELSHACCVRHHGDEDYLYVLWSRDVSGKVPVIHEYLLDDFNNIRAGEVAENRVVHIFDETAPMIEIPATDPMFDSPIKIYVGAEKDGQHSGNESCYMRYACAGAYLHPRKPAIWRVLVPDGEVIGSTLCDSKTGTGVNERFRRPWPRYGDASTNGCIEQVNCVDGSMP